MKKDWWTFKRTLWLLALAAVLWLLGGPVFMSIWARRFWKEIPCHFEEKGIFFYAVGDDRYRSTREDFWQGKFDTVKTHGSIAILQDNGTCWINPGDPEKCVHSADALTNWSNSGSRIASSIMVLAVAAGVTLFGAGKGTSDAASQTQENAQP